MDQISKNATPISLKKKRNDLIFIVSLLLLVMTVGFAFFILRGEGNTVRVTVDGELYGEYSLSEDRTVEIITGNSQENINRLVIKDGEAYVEYASCPDGICASHRAISRDGESIVCLPHKVVVTVDIIEEQDEPDIIV